MIEVVKDLRSKIGPIRDQFERPLCLAFATSDANSMLHSTTDLFSVEYLSYHSYSLAGKTNFNEGLTVSDIKTALKLEGQTTEKNWPYVPIALSPVPPPANLKPLYRATANDNSNCNAKKLIELIGNDQSVIIGTQITQDFLSLTAPFIISVGSSVIGNHAMLAVGIGQDDNQLDFIQVRNSWGPAWGEGGYAWLSSEYINTHVKEIIVLEQ